MVSALSQKTKNHLSKMYCKVTNSRKQEKEEFTKGLTFSSEGIMDCGFAENMAPNMSGKVELKIHKANPKQLGLDFNDSGDNDDDIFFL